MSHPHDGKVFWKDTIVCRIDLIQRLYKCVSSQRASSQIHVWWQPEYFWNNHTVTALKNAQQLKTNCHSLSNQYDSYNGYLQLSAALPLIVCLLKLPFHSLFCVCDENQLIKDKLNNAAVVRHKHIAVTSHTDQYRLSVRVRTVCHVCDLWGLSSCIVVLTWNAAADTTESYLREFNSLPKLF